jgi:ABC-type transport system involved in multi-copper enzyme maturation permease subunit
MTTQRETPRLMSVMTTLFGVTWKRLLRGRALWVCAVIAILPALIAGGLRNVREMPEMLQFAQFRVMALLPPIFIASSIGEEIEDRTITYLWSRPIARWTLVVGKIAALAPVAIALILAGWVVATLVQGKQPMPQELVAFAAGTIVISMIAAGIATLVPRQGMSLSIIYLVIIDATIGAIPASLRDISVTRQVWLLSGLEGTADLVTPVITLAVIAAIWLSIAFARVRRLES